ncbi:hypothetical protein GCM10012287_55080 [Streptomyces daqingensis]|uniref:Uncharacterized protein n=1 Tax=Streptomyces daqingensis TaxID=1472640 RepID=A0ABQ2MSI6_9ACTN|nr:hypothetical protein [Streptomyces daqingensis]GGO57980.1 hypothetical protein GCM10012287_55080 [Streptomyces daqingensis]
MTEPPNPPESTGKWNTPYLPQVPGVVQAAAILLYVGGALAILSGLWRLFPGGMVGAVGGLAAILGGALSLGLGRALQLGRRWAWKTVLVLCAVGIALAVVRVFFEPLLSGASDITWPVVFAILLGTRTAREWFAEAP